MPFFQRLPRWLVTAMVAEAFLLLGAIGLFGARYWPMAEHQSTAAIGVPQARHSHGEEAAPVVLFTDSTLKNNAEADAALKDRQLAAAKVGPSAAHEATH